MLSSANLGNKVLQAKQTQLLPLFCTVILKSLVLLCCCSYVDCRALSELFLFMDSCPVVKLCKGEREIKAEVSMSPSW